MLLQTNSYIVPKEKRAEHARLMARFRRCFDRLGSHFEVYEQTGNDFTGSGGGRFVQLMRFHDRRHQHEVSVREKEDAVAQQLIADFCQLVNLPYQQQQGLFAAGYYTSLVADKPASTPTPTPAAQSTAPPADAEPIEPPVATEEEVDAAVDELEESETLDSASAGSDEDFENELEGEVVDNVEEPETPRRSDSQFTPR